MADHGQDPGLKVEPMPSRGKRRAPSSSHDAIEPSSQSTQHPPPPPCNNDRPAFQVPSLPNRATPQPQMQRNHMSKIAIPRLRRDSDIGSAVGSSKGGERHRVNHACEPCRHRKTKCSGERPVCKHCEDFKIACLYADGKRDRLKKEFGNMTGKLEEYEKLLRELSLRVDERDQIMISKAMEKEVSPEEDDLRSAGVSVVSAYLGPEEREGEPEGEREAPAAAGSIGSLDRIDEDFNLNEETRATGYLGKNSEISWLRSLKSQTGPVQPSGNADVQYGHPHPGEQSTPPLGLPTATWTGAGREDPVGNGDGVPLSAFTYHCDDVTMLVPSQVDLYELPPKQTAEALFRNYLDTVHPAFPIIGKTTFSAQFRAFFERDKKPGNNWLAILNLIFAIGAKYSHLIQADWRGDERDHLLYFARARLLAMNSETILSHPDLQRVQVVGLMAFYLLAIQQINRAWILSGIAIRYGIALGLNLRNDNRKMLDTSKEIRYRVWWSLLSTERILAVMTGRTCTISDSDCTVPLPVPIEEEAFPVRNGGKLYGEALWRTPRSSTQESLSSDNSTSTPSSISSGTKITPASSASPLSQQTSFESFKSIAPNNALYFVHYTQLSVLSHEVSHTLYSPATMSESWARIQLNINTMDDKLERWRSSLPNLFDFSKKQRDQQFIRQRMSLGFSYYSVKILTNRPCLCKVDRRIPNQSGRSRDFNRSAAISCVHAARATLNLLPDEPNIIGLYKISPWWCLLHYLMQAASVLMLELAIRADHMPFEAEDILQCAKKAVRWLNKMSDECLAAYRAWELCTDLLTRVASRVGRDVHDLPGCSHGVRNGGTNGYDSKTTPSNPAYNQGGNRGTSFEPTNFTGNFSTSVSYGTGGQVEHALNFYPSIYAVHDEFVPYDPSAISLYDPHIGSMFPESGQVDAMVDGGYIADDMFYALGQGGAD